MSIFRKAFSRTFAVFTVLPGVGMAALDALSRCGGLR